MSLPEKLQAGQVVITTYLPYLSADLWSVKIVETEKMVCPVSGKPTLGVDAKWRLYYHPGVVELHPAPELGGGVAHEIVHLVLDHPARGVAIKALGPDERLVWNFAIDFEANMLLREAGIPLPKGAAFPSMFGLSEDKPRLSEKWFEMLMQQIRANSNGIEELRAKIGLCSGQDQAEGTVPGAGGADVKDSEGNPVPMVGEFEGELLRRATAEAIKQQGKAPAGFQRWAEQTLRPQVNWRKVLRSAIRRQVQIAAGAMDYSYQKPSRRSPPGIVLPSAIGYRPKVGVVVDTSGSMSEGELAEALTEVKGVLRTVGPIELVSVDAAVHGGRQKVSKVQQVELAGGGGTNMGAGIVALEGRADVVVVLTDGYTPWPEQKPRGMRVVVALVSSTGADVTGPEWATTVRIERETE